MTFLALAATVALVLEAVLLPRLIRAELRWLAEFRRRARIDDQVRKLDSGRLANGCRFPVECRDAAGRPVVRWRRLDRDRLREAFVAERARRGAGKLVVDAALAQPAFSLAADRPAAGAIVVARPRERRSGRRARARAGPDDSDSEGEGPHVGRRRRRGAPA
jgi:hypothetical protein